VPDQGIFQIMEGWQIMVSTPYTGLYQIRCVYKILMHWHKTINTGSIEEKKRKNKQKRKEKRKQKRERENKRKGKKRKEKKGKERKGKERKTSDKEMMPTHSPQNVLCMIKPWYNLEITINIQLR
jgi:hypothetical protein